MLDKIAYWLFNVLIITLLSAAVVGMIYNAYVNY